MHPVVTYNIAYIADIIGVRVYEEPPDLMMDKTVPICLHHIKEPNLLKRLLYNQQ